MYQQLGFCKDWALPVFCRCCLCHRQVCQRDILGRKGVEAWFHIRLQHSFLIRHFPRVFFIVAAWSTAMQPVIDRTFCNLSLNFPILLLEPTNARHKTAKPTLVAHDHIASQDPRSSSSPRCQTALLTSCVALGNIRRANVKNRRPKHSVWPSESGSLSTQSPCVMINNINVEADLHRW